MRGVPSRARNRPDPASDRESVDDPSRGPRFRLEPEGVNCGHGQIEHERDQERSSGPPAPPEPLGQSAHRDYRQRPEHSRPAPAKEPGVEPARGHEEASNREDRAGRDPERARGPGADPREHFVPEPGQRIQMDPGDREEMNEAYALEKRARLVALPLVEHEPPDDAEAVSRLKQGIQLFPFPFDRDPCPARGSSKGPAPEDPRVEPDLPLLLFTQVSKARGCPPPSA